MDIKDLLIATLEDNLTYPVILQGSLNDEDKYPDSFFTYFNNETNDESFFNNNPTRTIWNFDLNFYSIDPELVNTKILEGKNLLKNQGFIINGKGYDVNSDVPTHTGRGINVLFIEK